MSCNLLGCPCYSPLILTFVLTVAVEAVNVDRERVTNVIPLHHRRIAHDETISHADGSTTSISVHGSIPTTVVELGPGREHGGVLFTRCTDDAVELFTSTPEWWFAVPSAIGAGTVIIAPPELGCKPQAGQEEKEWLKEATAPFYRRVSNEAVKRLSVPPPVEASDNLTANSIKTGAWVRVVSTEVGLFGCFGPSTTLEATHSPPPVPPNDAPDHTDADTNNIPSIHLQSATTNRSGTASAVERKRRISFGADEEAKLTFKYNTDSGTSASIKDKFIYKGKDSSKVCQAGCSSRRSQGLITADAAKACKLACGGGGSNFETAVKCHNCYGFFEAGIKIKFKIKAWLCGFWHGPGARVEHAVFKMFGELRTEATLVADIQASKRITRSVDFFGKKSLGRVTIWAGPIPIYITSAFTLGASVEINAMLEGEASAGFKFSRRIEAGYQLVNGGWSEIKKSTGNGLEKIGPTFSAEASMSATLRLVPEVSLTFYGFAQLKVSVQPGLYVDTYAACKYKSGLWSSPSWRGRRSCDGVNWEVAFDVPLHVTLDASDGGVAALEPFGFNPRKLLKLPRKFGPYYLISKTKLKAGCLKVGYCAKRNPPPPPPQTTRRTTAATTRRTTVATTKATASPPPPPSVPNACKDPINAGYNSGCSIDAACKTASDDASIRECTCLDGFEGDGVVCRVKEPCAASSCDACLTDDRCTWCPNPPQGGKSCALQGTFTSGSVVCTGGTWDDVCSAPETPISSITIATVAGTITAGTSTLIKWSGGPADAVGVSFFWSACEDCALKTGLGLPTSAPNRGTFTWNIPSEIFNADAFKVTITSTRDPANTATSPGYKIKGGVAEVFKWVEGFYGHCSELCGTGEQERSVKCKSQAGREDASGCGGSTKPSSKRACNTQSCSRTLSLCSGFTPERLRQRGLIQGSTGVCQCLPQNRADMVNGKKEEFCGFKHSFMGTVGCNEDFCCNPLSSTAHPGNTRDCHDPCRTDSRFVVNQKGECSKTCGGGTRSLGYICNTPVLKGEPSASQNQFDGKYYRSCVSTHCEINDGKLVSGKLQKKYARDMPQTESCNTHACPTYTWVAAVPTTCSEPCGGGTGDSVVTCQSSEQKTVDISFCAEQPYELMTIGTCARDSLFIPDARDCAAAATVLGLSSTTVKSASQSSNPYGCYFKPGAETLWFNPAGNKEDDDLERVSLCKQGGAPPTTAACNEFACEQVPLQLELPLVAQSTDGSNAGSLDAVTGIHPVWKSEDTVKFKWAGGIYKRGIKLSWSAQPDELVEAFKSDRMVPLEGCTCTAVRIGGKSWPAFCQSDADDEQPRCFTSSSASQCPSRKESSVEKGKYYSDCSSEQNQAYAKLEWTEISTLKENPYVYEWKIPKDMAPVQYILMIVAVSDLSSDVGEAVSEAVCKSYAAANTLVYKGRSTCDGDCAPRGCYIHTSGTEDTVWWNADKNGKCSASRTCVYAKNVHHEPFGVCIMSGTDSDAVCLPCHPSCSANDGAGCTGTTAFDCKKCKKYKVERDRRLPSFGDTDDDGMCIEDCPADTVVKGASCIDIPTATTVASTTVTTITTTTATTTTATTVTKTTTTETTATTTTATTVTKTTTTKTTATTTTATTVTKTTTTTTTETAATTTTATTVTKTTTTKTTVTTTTATTVTGTTATKTSTSVTVTSTTTTTNDEAVQCTIPDNQLGLCTEQYRDLGLCDPEVPGGTTFRETVCPYFCGVCNVPFVSTVTSTTTTTVTTVTATTVTATTVTTVSDVCESSADCPTCEGDDLSAFLCTWVNGYGSNFNLCASAAGDFRAACPHLCRRCIMEGDSELFSTTPTTPTTIGDTEPTTPTTLADGEDCQCSGVEQGALTENVNSWTKQAPLPPNAYKCQGSPFSGEAPVAGFTNQHSCQLCLGGDVETCYCFPRQIIYESDGVTETGETNCDHWLNADPGFEYLNSVPNTFLVDCCIKSTSTTTTAVSATSTTATIPSTTTGAFEEETTDAAVATTAATTTTAVINSSASSAAPSTTTLSSTMAVEPETGDEDFPAVPTATSSRASTTVDEPGAAVDEAGGSGSGIVVSIVIVLILGAMLGYVVYRRKQANNGTLNEGGVTQRYENPAYDDGSSSSDGKDNLTTVIESAATATKPAANAETAFDSDDGFDIDNFFGKMVTAGDADGDGMVSLEEAIALGMDTSTFNDIDADGNGQLTNAEVTMWSENHVGEAVGMLNEDGDFEC